MVQRWHLLKGPEGSYIGSLMKGTVQVVDIPNDEQLKEDD